MSFKATTIVLLGLICPSFCQKQCNKTWKCRPTTTPPVLDANHSEWKGVEAYRTSLITPSGTEYKGGKAAYRCMYDSKNIYFALEIPGDYRFSDKDDHLCAAVATMMKIGKNATFVNMGGCPDALGGCDGGIPATCDDYRVDIGGHWELSGTKPNTLYDVSKVGGTGDDLIANKDDEYGVSPFCRFDDDDANADNEWAGAWAHTSPVDGEFGTYHFELSRSLRTASLVSDAQLKRGETIQFGVAFWDPFELEETGWTEAGHFVTGCGKRWIDLELVTEAIDPKEEGNNIVESSFEFSSPPAPVMNRQPECNTTWKCLPTSSPPILDADHGEWEGVEAYITSLVMPSGTEYENGQASYQCMYDSENIYFALEIPGDYRFSEQDNHLCAAIATMMKIGEKATFLNMGGCPDALGGCEGGIPTTCDDYRVDIGGHWELSGTQPNTLYDVSSSVSVNRGNETSKVGGTGDDPIANKDDEYGVSPFCRFDDDDADADNEWAGAWAHTSPVDGEFGTYHFELSRKLRTTSLVSDAQLTEGETIQFGVAFWDPYEIEESGWSNPGHYVTGCGNKWIDLDLVTEEIDPEEEEDTEDPLDETSPTPEPVAIDQPECNTTWKCLPTTSPPILDADHGEWEGVEAYMTSLVMPSGTEYQSGQASYQCRYDSENIYFALEIPGDYRFSDQDNHLCAAIATMMKIGEKATFLNMGGCPDALGGCDGGIPTTCDDYRVDIGGHWELSGTKPNTLYDVSSSVSVNRGNETSKVGGTGDDLIANKDDEYGVSPFCRFDDDDADADNEWAGAWAHTSPVDGEFGTYHFELSRKLRTASLISDAQLTKGETIQFGVAFWDPYEIEESGWSNPGHYVTGCGNKWIDLELVSEEIDPEEEEDAEVPLDETSLTSEPVVNGQPECNSTWKCFPSTSPPNLDADLSEWESVEAYMTSLITPSGTEYQSGQASYRCMYDSESIYFAFEIPGDYRFSDQDDHLCAAVATMMKIGKNATFIGMGGCPDALAGCDGGVPTTCDDYRVDIGGHWELSGTKPNTLYNVSSRVSSTGDNVTSKVGGTGDDPIANKDDEYAVSPFCRFDDDDADADNEWAGAWAHTNPVDGEFGTYHFELSRKLRTASLVSDAQLTKGETIQFGVAFWDPFEMEETGWSNSGHFVTGCGNKWIDLELVAEAILEDSTEEDISDADPVETSGSDGK